MKCDLYYVENIIGKDHANELRSKIKEITDDSFVDNPSSNAIKTSSVYNCYLGGLNGLLDNVIDVALNCNKDLYGFDLHSPNVYDVIHYNVYNEQSEYDWHIDASKGEPYDVKLTVIVDISSDSYSGGEFKFFKNGPTHVDQFIPGSMIIFPSYMPHKVEPVQHGVRESVSLFLAGPNWK